MAILALTTDVQDMKDRLEKVGWCAVHALYHNAVILLMLAIRLGYLYVIVFLSDHIHACVCCFIVESRSLTHSLADVVYRS